MDAVASVSGLGWGTVILLFVYALARAMPSIIESSTKWITARAARIAADAAAVKGRADAKVAEAQARKVEAENTGRHAVSQDERIDDLVERLHACEAKHDAAERRIDALEAKLRERDAAIGALMVEVRALHQTIASGGVPEHDRLLRAATRFLAALRADGWSPATAHTQEATIGFEAALTSAREAAE